MSQRRRDPEAHRTTLEDRVAALEAAIAPPPPRTTSPELEAYYAQTRRPDVHRRSKT